VNGNGKRPYEEESYWKEQDKRIEEIIQRSPMFRHNRADNGHDTSEERGTDEPQNPYDNHKLPNVEWIDRRISDWNEAELPDRLWVVPDWIPREQVTGLYGPPGVNKTDFLIQLLMSTSLGLPFLGYQLERMPAFGLFCEDTAVEIARRAARIASHHGMYLSEFPDFHYASLVGHDDLEFVTFDRNTMAQTRALKRFDMIIEQTGAALACLDTAPHFFGGSEIDRRQVSRFLRKLDAISIVRGCGIVITAHPSARGAKAGGRMDSGSTGWEGGVRARIALTKSNSPDGEDEAAGRPPEDTNERTLTLWKSNYAPPGKTLELVWNKGVFTTAALDPEKAQQRGPGRNVACEEKFLELLRAVYSQGGYVHDSANVPARYAPLVFATSPNGKGFGKPEYKRAMDRLLGKNRLRYETKRSGMRLVENTTADGQNATLDESVCV
jgi:RecA-family ATPase